MKIGMGLSVCGSARHPLRTGGFSLGAISDPHVPPNLNLDKVITCLAWLLTTAQDLRCLLVAGDLEENMVLQPCFKDWLYDPVEGAGWPTSIPVLPSPGNHDGDIDSGGPHEETTETPYSFHVGNWPQLYEGKEWYAWQYESLLILSFNNNTDYLQEFGGHSAFYNVNPPGHDLILNDDHSGITIPGSPLRQFLDSASARTALWKIGMCHRGLWVPYDTDGMRLNRGARPAMAVPIDNGLFLLIQGHVHVGSLSGPWYPTAPNYEEHRNAGQIAAYSMSLIGGYAAREVQAGVLPDQAHTLLWGSGGVGGSGLCHAALLDFEGDLARLRIFECSNADPTGAVVYDTFLLRQGGTPQPVEFIAAGAVAHEIGGNVVPALPAGWAANDLFLLQVVARDNIAINAPNGWTVLDSGTNNGLSLRTHSFYRVAQAGDAAPTVVHSGGSFISAVISAFRGVSVNDPISVTSAVSVNAAGTTLTANGLTTGAPNEMLLFMGGTGNQATISAYSGTPTPDERVDGPNTANYPEICLATSTIPGGGTATGVRTATISTARTSNGHQVTLRPAIAG